MLPLRHLTGFLLKLSRLRHFSKSALMLQLFKYLKPGKEGALECDKEKESRKSFYETVFIALTDSESSRGLCLTGMCGSILRAKLT